MFLLVSTSTLSVVSIFIPGSPFINWISNIENDDQDKFSNIAHVTVLMTGIILARFGKYSMCISWTFRGYYKNFCKHIQSDMKLSFECIYHYRFVDCWFDNNSNTARTCWRGKTWGSQWCTRFVEQFDGFVKMCFGYSLARRQTLWMFDYFVLHVHFIRMVIVCSIFKATKRTSFSLLPTYSMQ